MENPEIQKKMDFIVEQQAQFAAEMRKLDLAQRDMTTKHDSLTEAMKIVASRISKLPPPN